MASPIEFKLILCLSAVSDQVNGTLHMLGAGWSVTGSPTSPQAVALLIKVPWDRANQKLPVRVELLNADGQAVLVPGPSGSQPILTAAEMEVGRPPGVAPGSHLDAAMALNFPQLPLAPGRYQWRVDIGGDVQTESFMVRAV